MGDFAYSKDNEHNDLLELHNCLIELEKIEIQRSRENIPKRVIEKKYQETLERFSVIAGIVQDRQIIAINSRVSDLLGFSSSELIGSNFDRYIHPSELPEILELYGKRLSGNEVPIIYETILKRRNGYNIYVQITTSLFTYIGMPANFAIIKVLGETI